MDTIFTDINGTHCGGDLILGEEFTVRRGGEDVLTGLGGGVPTTRTVNGYPLSADVTVTKGDIGLSSCDDTADADKPVSTAQQSAIDEVANSLSAALEAKAEKDNPIFTGIVKLMPTTFSTLPGFVDAGAIAFITDGNTTTIGQPVSGGGSNTVLIYHNGLSWLVMGGLS